MSKIIGWMTSLGMISMFLLYGVYLLDIQPSFIPIDQVVQTWHLPTEEFWPNQEHQRIDLWDRFSNGIYSDISVFFPVAWLSCIMIVVYICVIRHLKENKALFFMAIFQIVVLGFAAAGLAGGHS